MAFLKTISGCTGDVAILDSVMMMAEAAATSRAQAGHSWLLQSANKQDQAAL